ncbi:MAG TPA: acetylxylan esterase [Polyangiaceae bacterium]|jgi:cephalosporin-C deacetylase
MALFDLPLEQLKTYAGTNPCPPDHAPYWERALAEMKSVEPKVELVPADFQISCAECFHLYFTGVRGARVHAKFLRPRHAEKPYPAILEFHGYSGSSGDWSSKLGWVALGFSVASLDCRGQGGLSEDTGGVKGTTLNGHIIRGLLDEPDHLLFRHIFLDTAELAAIVMAMDEVDATRVGATGGSQGGGLTLACAALEPRIRRAAPVYPFLCDYERVWDLDLAERAYAELKAFFRNHDPTHERHRELFTKLGYIDVQHLASRIQAEVLMGIGLMDTVCPPSTQFAAYNKIKSRKQHVIFPDFAHEGLPGQSDRIFTFLAALAGA